MNEIKEVLKIHAAEIAHYLVQDNLNELKSDKATISGI